MAGGADNPVLQFARSAIPVAVLLIGTACSIFAFWEAQKAEEERINAILELRAAWRTGDLQNKLEQASIPVQSLKTFVVSQDFEQQPTETDPSEFKIFASQARGDSPVAHLLWAPIIDDEDRAAFEKAAGHENGISDFAVSEFHGTDLVPAPHRPVYAPVRFEQRFAKQMPLLGFDHFSEPVRRAAAEAARDSGTPVATPLVLPLPGQGLSQRLILYNPIYRHTWIPRSVADRREQIVGFTIGTYPAADLVDFALRNTPSILETLSLVIGEPSDLSTVVPLARAQPGKEVVDSVDTPLGDVGRGAVRLTRSFNALGRDWTLVFDFSAASIADLHTSTRWGYLVLGLALTLALASYVAAQQRRQHLVEAQIGDRTAELHRTADQLQAMFASSPLATTTTDPAGRVTSWNRAAEQLFGLLSDDVIGKPSPLMLAGNWPVVHDLVERVLKGETFSGLEVPLTVDGGKMIDGSVSAASFRDRQGAPQGIVFTIADITPRKIIERQIARERDMAQRYLDVAGVMILALNPDCRVALINQHGCNLLGYAKPAELIGLPWIDTCIPQRDRESMRRRFERLTINIGREFEFAENPVLTKAGTERILAWHNTVLTDEAGRVIGTLSSAEDVTDRRRVETALRRNQEHLARVQSIAHIGSAEYNFRTGEATWSDEIYHFLGIPPARDTNLPLFMDRVHLDDRARLTELAKRGRSGVDVEPMEFRIVNTEGQTRWYYRQSQVTRDSNGEPVSQIATVFDITDRKIAEAARMASEEQYHLTFDMAPVGIAHVDMNGNFILVNQTLCSLFQRGEAEMLGHNFRDFTHPEDMVVSDAFTPILVARETTSTSWEKRFLRKDGELLWCRLTSTLTMGDDKTPSHYITVYIDITAAKQNETKRAELEAQLVQAQKMEAVGRLTGGVAHDFNNLLTVVLGNLDLVREQVEDHPKLVRQIDAAVAAGKRGADLTHRLLAFSRRQPLEPVVVDINQRINELVPMLRRTLGETIELKQKLNQGLWRVVVDPGQLENAILNLAVNSRDAMPDGGKLEITTENIAVDDTYAADRRELSSGNYVRISVSDSGTGMPPEVIAKAFDPFFTTKEVGKGTGLGLSMVYGFVKQSGGHAAIYSEIGIGTTLTLLLPADPTMASEIAAQKTVAPQRGHETILVVEDDPAVRAVTVSFLDALGYSVIQAGTVKEGFELFAALPGIDLILTDVILPGGADGSVLAQQARDLRPEVNILFMSGYTEDVVMHNGRLDEGVALLRKPFTRVQLANKVRSVIDGEAPKS